MPDPSSAPGYAPDCPCIQTSCVIWGNCVECVRGHRLHGRHVPERMQELLRGLVADLAEKVEFGVADARPKPDG